MSAKIAVVLDGGLVESVLTFDGGLVGHSYVVIDKDLEDLPEDELDEMDEVVHTSDDSLDYQADVRGCAIELSEWVVPGQFGPEETDSDVDDLPLLDSLDILNFLPDRYQKLLAAVIRMTVRHDATSSAEWTEKATPEVVYQLLRAAAENNRPERLRPRKLV